MAMMCQSFLVYFVCLYKTRALNLNYKKRTRRVLFIKHNGAWARDAHKQTAGFTRFLAHPRDRYNPYILDPIFYDIYGYDLLYQTSTSFIVSTPRRSKVAEINALIKRYFRRLSPEIRAYYNMIYKPHLHT